MNKAIVAEFDYEGATGGLSGSKCRNVYFKLVTGDSARYRRHPVPEYTAPRFNVSCERRVSSDLWIVKPLRVARSIDLMASEFRLKLVTTTPYISAEIRSIRRLTR
ncbi:hypothetical protein DPMN_076675 [Dreissena polymorpha]|uniref:Uncharacterized protein n=1 Tax=Dreissena polymorpha TaxID=45954 RepID=A0A9D3YP34_DREPO|nr:hypothetical protein DPMN_076675 [Dreissena polymorpha]